MSSTHLWAIVAQEDNDKHNRAYPRGTNWYREWADELSDPNMQQIPRGVEYRRCFVAAGLRAREGGLLQVELDRGKVANEE